MKISLQLKKEKNFLIIEDYDGTGDKIAINTDKNSADRTGLKWVKRDGGFYIGESEEMKEYYKEIK